MTQLGAYEDQGFSSLGAGAGHRGGPVGQLPLRRDASVTAMMISSTLHSATSGGTNHHADTVPPTTTSGRIGSSFLGFGSFDAGNHGDDIAPFLTSFTGTAPATAPVSGGDHHSGTSSGAAKRNEIRRSNTADPLGGVGRGSITMGGSHALGWGPGTITGVAGNNSNMGAGGTGGTGLRSASAAPAPTSQDPIDRQSRRRAQQLSFVHKAGPVSHPGFGVIPDIKFFPEGPLSLDSPVGQGHKRNREDATQNVISGDASDPTGGSKRRRTANKQNHIANGNHRVVGGHGHPITRTSINSHLEAHAQQRINMRSDGNSSVSTTGASTSGLSSAARATAIVRAALEVVPPPRKSNGATTSNMSTATATPASSGKASSSSTRGKSRRGRSGAGNSISRSAKRQNHNESEKKRQRKIAEQILTIRRHLEEEGITFKRASKSHVLAECIQFMKKVRVMKKGVDGPAISVPLVGVGCQSKLHQAKETAMISRNQTRRTKLMSVLSRLGDTHNQHELIVEVNADRTVSFAYGTLSHFGGSTAIDVVGKVFDVNVHVEDRARVLKAFSAWWKSGNDREDTESPNAFAGDVRDRRGKGPKEENDSVKRNAKPSSEAKNAQRNDIMIKERDAIVNGNSKDSVLSSNTSSPTKGWGHQVRGRSLRYRREVGSGTSARIVWVEAVCISPPKFSYAGSSSPRSSSATSSSSVLPPASSLYPLSHAVPTMILCERNVTAQVNSGVAAARDQLRVTMGEPVADLLAPKLTAALQQSGGEKNVKACWTPPHHTKMPQSLGLSDNKEDGVEMASTALSRLGHVNANTTVSQITVQPRYNEVPMAAPSNPLDLMRFCGSASSDASRGAMESSGNPRNRTAGAKMIANQMFDVQSAPEEALLRLASVAAVPPKGRPLRRRGSTSMAVVGLRPPNTVFASGRDPCSNVINMGSAANTNAASSLVEMGKNASIGNDSVSPDRVRSRSVLLGSKGMGSLPVAPSTLGVLHAFGHQGAVPGFVGGLSGGVTNSFLRTGPLSHCNGARISTNELGLSAPSLPAPSSVVNAQGRAAYSMGHGPVLSRGTRRGGAYFARCGKPPALRRSASEIPLPITRKIGDSLLASRPMALNGIVRTQACNAQQLLVNPPAIHGHRNIMPPIPFSGLNIPTRGRRISALITKSILENLETDLNEDSSSGPIQTLDKERALKDAILKEQPNGMKDKKKNQVGESITTSKEKTGETDSATKPTSPNLKSASPQPLRSARLKAKEERRKKSKAGSVPPLSVLNNNANNNAEIVTPRPEANMSKRSEKHSAKQRRSSRRRCTTETSADLM